MNEKEYKETMGLNTRDVGSVHQMRKYVNELLEERGYSKIKGWKPMRELVSIKRKLLQSRVDSHNRSQDVLID